MADNLKKLHRRSIRLKEYDYSQAGGYFVTICTHNQKYLFGKIIDTEMRLNQFGKTINEFWNRVPDYFQNVQIDQFIIMPNHIHGIVMIAEPCRGGVSPPHHRGEVTSPLQKRTLGQIVAFFKYQTTSLINQIRRTPGASVWQRNYWEHVIRNEDKLFKIRQYIHNNPLKWHLDRENPERIGSDSLEDEIFRGEEKRDR